SYTFLLISLPQLLIGELTQILKGNIFISPLTEKSTAQTIREEAEKEIKRYNLEEQRFTEEETWLMKILYDDLDGFTKDTFNILPLELQKSIYQTANNLCNVPLV